MPDDQPHSVPVTLDSSPSLLLERPEAQSPPLSCLPSPSNPALTRNLSSSKLNAKAAEFVPTRAVPAQSKIAISPPPPPPPGLVPLYPSPPYVPIRGQLPHTFVQNHSQFQHHNQNDHHNLHHHQYGQYPYHQKQRHQYYGTGRGNGELEGAVTAQQVSVEMGDHVGVSGNVLSDEASQKILNQVEYYFSDVNLATTDHLMKFINKDPEGYVPISVVVAFKKIKAVISNNSQLAAILKNSSKLAVSEDGKKVRRQQPLTELDMEELQSRIVVAENLPEDHCHQKLMKIFSAVGSVKSIRTCQPQPCNGGISSAARPVKGDGSMFYSNKLHAFVEYETVEMAENAVAELNDAENWRSGLRVRLLHKPNPKPAHTREKKGHESEGNGEGEASASEQQRSDREPEDTFKHTDAQSYEPQEEEHGTDREDGQKKGRGRGRARGRGRGQNHHNNNHHANPHHGGTPPLQQQQSPPGPRMPDGTRGFATGRGKPIAVNIL